MRPCFLFSLIKCRSVVPEKMMKMVQPITGSGGHLSFWIGLKKKTNLVEDVEILLPVKLCQIPTDVISAVWEEKKEEIWLSPVTKTPTPTEQSKKATWQHKNATKNFDYTTIADRLRTVSWSNSSHPTGVVKPVYERSTFPLTTTAVQSKGHTFNNL